MAWKRTTVGSIMKGRDGGKDYLKFTSTLAINRGDCFVLESKKTQLENIEEAQKNGKLSEDLVEKIKERIESIPDFVRFEIIKLERK